MMSRNEGRVCFSAEWPGTTHTRAPKVTKIAADSSLDNAFSLAQIPTLASVRLTFRLPRTPLFMRV